jgi:hypothetical protein
VEREQSVEVKKALVQSWMHLVSGFGSSLPTVFSRVRQSCMPLSFDESLFVA